MGYESGHRVLDECREGFSDRCSDECDVAAMPRRGTVPLCDCAPPARSRPAALFRRAGVARRSGEPGKVEAQTQPLGTDPCENGRAGRWLLPVILGGAAVWVLLLAWLGSAV